MAGSIGTAYINIAPNMSGIQGKIASGLKGSGSQFAEQFGGEISGKSAVIIGAIAGVAQTAVTKAMSLVTDSISTAVRRVDTLSNAQKTFQYMGFAANDAAEATKNITASIQGLPTPLDGAIRGMTSLAATYGDVKLGQKVFTALNDSILGFGGTADMVDNAIQQLSQLPMDGPLDAQTWNSLRNSGITPVLVAMSKDMGLSVSQLKTNLGDGTLKVQDFINELIKLDTQGGGGLTNLATIAHNATSGINTGFANMQTAVARGLAKIIQAIGQQNISNAIAAIGSTFEKVLTAIADTIPKVVNGIKDFFGYVNKNKDIFYPIAIGIGAIVAAITAWKSALLIWSGITKVAAAAQAAFNAVMALNPITVITLALVGLTAGLTYFFTQTEVGRKIFSDFTNFMVGVWNNINSAIKAVTDFMSSAWTSAKDAVVGALNTIGSVAKSVFNAIAGFINDNKTTLINIGIIIGTIVLPKIIAIGIQAGIAAAKAIASFVSMAASAVANAAVATAAWVVSAAKSVAGFIASIPKIVAQFAVASASAIANAAIVTATWVASAARTLAGWAVTFAAYLAGIAAAALQTLIAGAQMAASWLLALGPIGLIIAAVAGATALIIANWDTVKNVVSAAWGAISGAAAAAWNFITGVFGGIGQWFVDRSNDVKNAFVGIAGWFGNIFSAAWRNILNGFGNIGGWARDRFNDIVNAFSGVADVGKNIVQGLWNGISDMGKWISQKLKEFGDNVLKSIKDFFGIHSPSKVFAWVGKMNVVGFANGISDNTGIATKAVSNLADSAMAGIANNDWSQNYAAQVNTTSGPASAQANNGQTGDTMPQIVQNNSIYNQVDLNSVTRELAWQIRR